MNLDVVRQAPDDRAKDDDSLGFVRGFEPAERERWIAWATRVRLADRLAETDPAALRMLRAFDYGDEPRHADAWSSYLDALAHYGSGYVVKTLADHDEMLRRLSGPIVQLAPGMPEELWEAAGHFGALDQFFNNLRDIQEDAERGMCWLPEEVLRWYGITRADVISGRAPAMAGWCDMVGLWLGSYLASLRDAAAPFLEAVSLPAPLLAMRTWTLWRYARIERTLSAVDYDYRRFQARYWGGTKLEVA